MTQNFWQKLSFAKRITGTGYPFEEDSYRALILEEIQRDYDPTQAVSDDKLLLWLSLVTVVRSL
ncbi:MULTISPECIES: hypothetical protein [Paenibacillus]|uniref:hypothetical protein n=1 Tax=Paenibacillus TaxID=44249 RepID=UPI00096DEF35|nr:hypothetical protein [Paenibacillus odorifer]OMD55425.1 hypothetical protein BSK55_24345 [Paenibacillus odorifer]OMD73025.1 hypothetical protein BSK50_23555 [Paenibacillus odorifer]